jgi:hypothetical protein
LSDSFPIIAARVARQFIVALGGCGERVRHPRGSDMARREGSYVR